MKKLALILCSLTLVAFSNTRAAQFAWDNIGPDFNTATNWTPDTVPSGNNVAVFSGAAAVQPNVSAPLSTAGLLFTALSSGYNLTNSNGAVLTLTATGTSNSGSGGTNSTTAAISALNTSSSNTLNGALLLAPATGTQSTFQQAGGGTLIVNSDVSSAAGINLSLRGAGTIQLNGNNSFATASIDTANATLVVGNNAALGAGTFTVNNTATIQAGGGSRTISNGIVVAGNTTLSGTNAFTFNGPVTSSGANSRTLTVSNTGGATFGGSVFLQEAGASGRTFTINGTSAVVVNGAVQNGGTGPATLRYSGSSTLTLNSSSNTYSGGTQLTISGATIIANADGSLGTGNVSLTASGVTLTLQNGVVNNYINDGANLSIVSGVTVNLNYSGQDSISMLVFNGATLAPGVYGSGASGAPNTLPELFGTGTLLVAVPEPGTYMLLGIGGLLCMQRFRRKKG